MKVIEQDSNHLDMIITTGSPSEARNSLSGMIDYESRDIAHESVRGYIVRTNDLMMKFNQNGLGVNDERQNHRILKGLPDGLSVRRRMLSMLSGVKFEDLGEALARIEEDKDQKMPVEPTH